MCMKRLCHSPRTPAPVRARPIHVSPKSGSPLAQPQHRTNLTPAGGHSSPAHGSTQSHAEPCRSRQQDTPSIDRIYRWLRHPRDRGWPGRGNATRTTPDLLQKAFHGSLPFTTEEACRTNVEPRRGHGKISLEPQRINRRGDASKTRYLPHKPCRS